VIHQKKYEAVKQLEVLPQAYHPVTYHWILGMQKCAYIQKSTRQVNKSLLGTIKCKHTTSDLENVRTATY